MVPTLRVHVLSGSYRQPATHNPQRLLLPAKRNWRHAVVLASRSDTGRRRRLADLHPYHYGSHAEEPSSVHRPRSWTRPSKEQESVPELGALFLVPTLRIHVLGEDQRSEERKKLLLLFSSRERSELSFFLGSYGPRSGTGATQSYWHREAILAAEGDWRIFATHYPLFTTHYGS